MKGAREYADLFETGQYGRLYIVSASHARGKTFRIQILPKNEKAISNGPINLCLNPDAVEVYGVVDGQPGWTESYGWLHQGKWIEDFNNMVEQRKEEIRKKENAWRQQQLKDEHEETARVNKLLAEY